MQYSKAVALVNASPWSHTRPTWLPENLVTIEQRAGEGDFEEFGVFGVLSKVNGTYRVSISYQYAIGEQQRVFVQAEAKDIRQALRTLYMKFQHCFAQTASRKLASLLVAGVRSEE